MAVLADVGGLYVCGMLTRRSCAVMTTDAVVGYAGMIEGRRYPGIGRMAEIAGVITGDMIGCLTHGCHAIMAAGTSTEYLSVIDTGYRYPSCISVTILADVRCLDMRTVLTCRRRAVMTACTIGRNTRVVKVRRYPTAGCVAIGTIVAALNMVGIFACRDSAVMTTDTTTLHIGMIDLCYRPPASNSVAAFTDLGRLDMLSMFTGRRGAIMATGTITRYTGVIIGSGSPGDRIVALITGPAICRYVGR